MLVNDSASRRDFLLSAGAFGAAVLLTHPKPLHADEPPAQSKNGDEPVSPFTSRTSADDVSAETIAHAEKLAGIPFTEAEREMMADSIGEQIARFRSRLKHPFHSNTLAPALRFDPLLPGTPLDFLSGRFARSRVDPGPLPDDDADIAFAPVTQLSRWIESGSLSSTRLTRIYIERIKHYDGHIKSVITLTEDLALRQAERADAEIAAGRYRGPLHGMPWGAKDLLDTVRIRTTWGAEPYVDRVPDADAHVVRLLDEAGAVLVGKLSLGALAYNDIWFGGRTNNPWNLEQGSSGSSAGSAAATAAGLVAFAIGTETLGSIVSPCMRCGTTGLRPTFGRVGRSGAMALCWSLDKIGPICRTVEDCMLVLRAMNGHDAHDPSSVNQPLAFDAAMPVKGGGVRIGWHPKWFEGRGAGEHDRAALDAVRTLGVDMVEVNLPDWPYDSLLNILLCEAAAAFEELTRSGQDDLLTWQEPQAWPNTFRQSWFIPGIELVQADRLRRRCMEMMRDVYSNVDVIIAPSYAASLLLISNNTGHPSLTIRCGFKRDKDGGAEVPHGITLIGRVFDEGTLCRVGMAIERELDVWSRRPRL